MSLNKISSSTFGTKKEYISIYCDELKCEDINTDTLGVVSLGSDNITTNLLTIQSAGAGVGGKIDFYDTTGLNLKTAIKDDATFEIDNTAIPNFVVDSSTIELKKETGNAQIYINDKLFVPDEGQAGQYIYVNDSNDFEYRHPHDDDSYARIAGNNIPVTSPVGSNSTYLISGDINSDSFNDDLTINPSKSSITIVNAGVYKISLYINFNIILQAGTDSHRFTLSKNGVDVNQHKIIHNPAVDNGKWRSVLINHWENDAQVDDVYEFKFKTGGNSCSISIPRFSMNFTQIKRL